MTELITWLGRRDHFFLVPSLGVGCVQSGTNSASATHNAELAQNRGIAFPTNTKTSP